MILRKIEGLIGNPLGSYTTSRLQAEHIFPKAAKISGPWFAGGAFDIDDPDIHRKRLGNYIILEEIVNNTIKAKTWKGDSTRHADDLTNYDPTSNHALWFTDNKNLGKFHGLVAFPWNNTGGGEKWDKTSSTPPTYTGSQLKAVKDFLDVYQHKNQWTKKEVEARTEYLLDEAVNKELFKI